MGGGANKNRELFGEGRKKIERHFFPNSDYLRHIDILRAHEDNLDFLDFLGLKNNTYGKTSYFRQFSTYLYISHLIMITGVVGSVT